MARERVLYTTKGCPCALRFGTRVRSGCTQGHRQAQASRQAANSLLRIRQRANFLLGRVHMRASPEPDVLEFRLPVRARSHNYRNENSQRLAMPEPERVRAMRPPPPIDNHQLSHKLKSEISDVRF